LGKKRRPRESDASSTPAPNNPFGGLAALRDALPLAPNVAPNVEADVEAAAGPPREAPGSSAAKIVVRREKKGRGGKTVTRVSGLTADERAPLAKQMKRVLGCGATVEGDDVVLLGSLVDRAADWLEARGARRVVRAR
jgi:translation initiation factor 1